MATAATSSPSLAPTSGAFRPILLYDKDAPATVVASVATARTHVGGVFGPGDYTEFHVTCAAPCPAGGFPPQTVRHKSGSIWGGHHVVADTTTAWGCDLGVGISMPCAVDLGCCYTTTLASGEPVPTSGLYTNVDTCQVVARTKMMFVTAGFDEYFKVIDPDTKSPISFQSAVTAALRSAGCPSSAFPTEPPTTESKPSTEVSKLTTTALTKGASATESTPTASQSTKSEAGMLSRGISLLTFMLAWSFILHI